MLQKEKKIRLNITRSKINYRERRREGVVYFESVNQALMYIKNVIKLSLRGGKGNGSTLLGSKIELNAKKHCGTNQIFPPIITIPLFRVSETTFLVR